MAERQLGDGYHFSLSIGKALWDDLVQTALPIKVKDGSYDVGRMVYKGVQQLGVKEKVVALLEDRQPPQLVVKAKDRAVGVWQNRRLQVYRALDRVVHIEGDWKVEVDRDGTEFRYARQKIGVDAHLKAVAHG